MALLQRAAKPGGCIATVPNQSVDYTLINSASVMRFALKTIAEWPVSIPAENMDAINMAKVAAGALRGIPERESVGEPELAQAIYGICDGDVSALTDPHATASALLERFDIQRRG
jgi:hypothetical protein